MSFFGICGGWIDECDCILQVTVAISHGNKSQIMLRKHCRDICWQFLLTFPVKWQLLWKEYFYLKNCIQKLFFPFLLHLPDVNCQSPSWSHTSLYRPLWATYQLILMIVCLPENSEGMSAISCPFLYLYYLAGTMPDTEDLLDLYMSNELALVSKKLSLCHSENTLEVIVWSYPLQNVPLKYFSKFSVSEYFCSLWAFALSW